VKQLHELPSNWIWTTISELGAVVSGGTPSTKETDYWGGDISWISPSDLTGYTNKYISYGAKSLTFAGLQNSSAKVMSAGSVHFSSRAPIGYTVISGRDMTTNQGFKSLVPSKGVFNEYVYYYFKASKQLAESVATGTTFKEISGSAFAKLPVPLPPEPEQRRIVVKIEELFSELDKGVESLKTAQAQLKVYRQALLKHAFEGKLTAQWRADNPDKLETADALLKRIQKEREQRCQQQVADWKASGKTNGKPKAPKPVSALTAEELSELPLLPNGWTWSKLEPLAAQITDGEHFRPPTTQEGIPFLSAKDVRDDGVSFSAPLFISQETADKAWERCKPQRGDILIVSRGATVGRMCVVNSDRPFSLLGSVILLKTTTATSPSFLLAALKAPLVNKKIVGVSGATAQQAIYLRDIQHVPVPVCSLQEQSEIIGILETKLSEVDQLEQTLVASLQQSEALRQSILKKAFSGQLVPQDPADEPASVLLARIKAEQSAAPKAKKARK